MSKPAKHFYEFGRFRIDTADRALLRDGEPVPLTPKAFEMLLVLIQNSGRVMEKNELMQRLWPDSFVEEANLTQQVHLLRNALGEGPGGSPYIVTVPRRGYRFVAVVRELGDEGDDLIPEQNTRSRVVVEEKEEAHESEKEILGEGAGQLLPPPSSPFTRGRRPSRQVLAVSLLFLGLVFIVSYFRMARRSKQADASPTVRSVAVLPFKPLGSEGSDEYLGLGMADALITKLSNLKQVEMRPTSAVLRYSSLDQDPLAVGRELGVEALLYGRIQRSGERIRVTVQLVGVRDGAPRWAAKFDEKFSDIFAVQDSISEQVAGALTLELTGEEKQRVTKRYTENTEAYQFHVVGRYHWNRSTIDGWKRGIEYFNRAIEKDPNYALAYTGLADAYVLLAADALPQTEGMPKAKAAALKALELDDTLAEGHASLAKVKASYDWDFPGAEREFKRALELGPNSAEARQAYSIYLAAMGRHGESIAEMKRAQELDPLSLRTNFGVGWAFNFARQYDQAIGQFRKTLEMDPNFAQAHRYLGWAYEQKGMHEEAITELQKAIGLSGGSATIKAELGRAYAVSGRRGQAENVLAELRGLSKQSYVSPYYIAMIYAALGERDQAFASLDKAYAERSRNLIFLKVNPVWDSLRSDPRFQNLLRRVGLPQ